MGKPRFAETLNSAYGKVVTLLPLACLAGLGYEAYRIPFASMTILEAVFSLILKIAKWAAIGWAIYLVLTSLLLSAKHRTLYGKNFGKLKRTTKKLMENTELWNFAVAGFFPSLLYAICAILLFLKIGEPDLLFLPLIAIARLHWIGVRFAQPPGILFLAASDSSEKVFNHFDIKSFVAPIRVAALLEYSKERFSPDSPQGSLFNSVYLDVFRTVFTPDWRDSVDRLIENVAIVVIDGRFVTDYTVYEAELILKNGLGYKTIFLAEAEGSVPLLAKLGIPPDDPRICVTDYCGMFRYLKRAFHDRRLPSPEAPLKGSDISDLGEPDFRFKSTTAEFYGDVGNKCMAGGMPEKAEQAFRMALATTTQNHESIWTNLAIISMNQGRFDSARERIANALEANNRHPNAILTAGMIEERAGNLFGAFGRFKEFLEVANPADLARIQYAQSRLYRSHYAVDFP